MKQIHDENDSKSSKVSNLNDSYRELFELHPSPMWIYDKETSEIIEANAAALKCYGYIKSDIIGVTIQELQAEGGSDSKLILPPGSEHKGVFSYHITKDGKVFPVEVNTRTIQFQGREATLLTSLDVTEQRRVEQAFIEVDRRYRSIFENAVEGFYQNLPSGKFINVNPAFAKMLGYQTPEQLCSEISNIETQLYVRPIRLQFRRLLERKNIARGLEFEAYRRDGSKIWVSVNVRVVRDDENRVLYYEGTAEDITARKRSEERLQMLNTSLELQAQELARSNAELQQFAYAASHDLQEPLRMVSSYLNLVALRYQGKLDRDADEFIHFAVDGAKRMKLLIDDLLAYSRVGRRDNVREPINCSALLPQILKNLEVSIQESKALVDVGQLPVIVGAPSQLAQLFQNLISNAIKFHGPAVPNIRISSELREGEWIFSVADNGIGMEMQYAERIFRIFQRLHAREEYPGTGVGLAICKKIVEWHGGRIWVESIPGNGATFYFSLPVTQGEGEEERDTPALTAM